MFDEDDKDGLGAMRGFMNAFLIVVLVALICGYVWRAVT